jgi:hypothetical protein
MNNIQILGLGGGLLLLLLMAVPLVWYNNARRELRPSHQSHFGVEFGEM